MVIRFIVCNPGDNGTMGQQLQMLKEQIMEVLKRCGQITKNIMMAGSTAEKSMDDIMKAEEAITRYVCEEMGVLVVEMLAAHVYMEGGNVVADESLNLKINPQSSTPILALNWV